ncbi:uncharacterized protein LOC124440108 [Xenia sp. Carnegie-2017]|uniref:uncharacterized protein LOC124440108 n=1 Tax=Xenia sp. Carnegie-2017 TaxID=2897299 RepID=UPI001F04AA4F|nr:uncharacterized protein LOC124440108 [Xenia sp. Carnegie-2017]
MRRKCFKKSITKNEIAEVFCVILLNFVISVHSDSRVSCKEMPSCKFNCSNIPNHEDIYVDLSALVKMEHSPLYKDIPDADARKSNILYDWSPCTKFGKTTFTCFNVFACQKIGSPPSSYHSLGSKLSAFYSTDSKHFILQYKSDLGRVLTVTLKYKNVDVKPKHVEEKGKEYTMIFYTKYAPRIQYKDDGHGGISVGTILCIIFLVVILLYLVIGIAWTHKQGAHGKERIPNYEFWREIPGLIQDGSVFSVKKTKECFLKCLRKDKGYETL